MYNFFKFREGALVLVTVECLLSHEMWLLTQLCY